MVSLRELLSLAAASGIADSLTIDLSVVRGLSYYTGTVWELFDAAGTMRAIAGGGRYDHLLESLGGQATPMVGFGFGDVVIADLLAEKGLLPRIESGPEEIVYPLSENELAAAMTIAAARRASGRRVAIDASFRRFKHVVSKAESDGAQSLWIIGANELTDNCCKHRRLADREEVTVGLADVGTFVNGLSPSDTRLQGREPKL